jgi:hypothetical protein
VSAAPYPRPPSLPPLPAPAPAPFRRCPSGAPHSGRKGGRRKGEG